MRLSLTFAMLLGAFTAKASGLSQMLDQYMQVKEALVASDFSKAHAAAAAYKTDLKSFKSADLPEGQKKAFKSAEKAMKKAVDQLQAATTLESQRKAFAELSKVWFKVMDHVKVSDKPVYRFNCSMKKEDWLSFDQAVKNPYYGKTMLNCGSLVKTY